MGYMNKISIIFLICFLCGCGFLKKTCRNNEELKNRKEKSLYLQHEWIKPVIQKVRIPAHITGGVFYPEHEELVIIKSGEWEMGKTVGIKKATQNQEHILLDEKGIDITALPRTENYFKGGEE